MAGFAPVELERLRARIDQLDQSLLEVLSERARCVLEIGRTKRRLGLAVYDPERERELLAALRRTNRGPLPDEAVVRLFERIIDESRRLERQAAERPED